MKKNNSKFLKTYKFVRGAKSRVGFAVQSRSQRLRGSETTCSHTKYGFTLAEVLITLAIIGIVAALTIPTLTKNYQTKQFEVAAKKFHSQMINLASRMNLEGEMYGSTSAAFLDRFKNYAKIIKVCDSSNLANCFANKVKTSDEKFDIADLKVPKSLGQTYTSDQNVGAVLADGTSLLISFDPNCSKSPFNNAASSVTSCMHFIADTNGKKGPNEVGKDVVSLNATIRSASFTGADLAAMGFVGGGPYWMGDPIIYGSSRSEIGNFFGGVPVSFEEIDATDPNLICNVDAENVVTSCYINCPDTDDICRGNYAG